GQELGARGRREQVGVGGDERPHHLGLVGDATPDAAVRVDTRQPETEHLARRRVPAEAHDRLHALAHARIGRREKGGPSADAHAQDDRWTGERSERRHDGRDVVRAQAPVGESGDRRDGDVEAAARQERRGLADAGVVLALGGEAVDEHQGCAAGGPGEDVAVHGGAGNRERLARRRGRQRRQRRQPALAQELDEERAGPQRAATGVRDGNEEDECEEEEAGEPGYFRLTHFTRRHPLSMFALATSAGSSPTTARSGPSARFDFQPSRVQRGATRSSSHAMTRRSLRKWLRMTRTPPGLTTRRISRRTAIGSGTAEIVYVATALSNSSSSKSMDVASMTLSVTFGIASVCTRSTALSSISSDRSIPVRRDAGG